MRPILFFLFFFRIPKALFLHIDTHSTGLHGHGWKNISSYIYFLVYLSILLLLIYTQDYIIHFGFWMTRHSNSSEWLELRSRGKKGIFKTWSFLTPKSKTKVNMSFLRMKNAKEWIAQYQNIFLSIAGFKRVHRYLRIPAAYWLLETCGDTTRKILSLLLTKLRCDILRKKWVGERVYINVS